MICGDPIKDRIVDHLSIYKAVPIKGIALGLHDAGFSLSQAQVYNIINAMLDAKMLTKQEGKVRLSARWIESIEEMVLRLQQQSDRDGISMMYPGEKKMFEAKTFHELNAIWHDISVQLFMHNQGDVFYYDPHPYHLLGEYAREKKDLMQAKKEKSSLWYVVGGTSFLDEYGRQLAEKNGAKAVSTKKLIFPVGEFWAVVGEYVYKITLDAKIIAYFDMFFETVTSLDAFRHDLFYDLFGMRGTFTLTLWKDSLYAHEIQERIQEVFAEDISTH